MRFLRALTSGFIVLKMEVHYRLFQINLADYPKVAHWLVVIRLLISSWPLTLKNSGWKFFAVWVYKLNSDFVKYLIIKPCYSQTDGTKASRFILLWQVQRNDDRVMPDTPAVNTFLGIFKWQEFGYAVHKYYRDLHFLRLYLQQLATLLFISLHR